MLERGIALVLAVLVVGALPVGARAEMSTEQRLRRLEESLKEAQDEIKFLRGELRRQKADTETTKTGIAETKKAQAEQDKKVEEAKKSISIPDWLKKVSLFGDFRYRHEGFYNQPTTEGTKVTARNRERIRARIGLKATFSDELSATFRLASGNPNDPISTNETLTNEFTPKNINLDWAFLTFTPGKTFGVRPGLVALTLGKYPDPIFRPGELLFDDDLSFEGVTETLALLEKPLGPLDQVRLYAIQATYQEVSNNQDGWLFGGQVNPLFHAGSTQIEAGFGQFGYLNPNLIAKALNTNSSLKNTNLLFGSSPNITGFQSRFQLTDVAAAVTVPNVISTMPVRVWVDYVHNWNAVNSSDNGYQGGVKLGQTKERGDWAIATYYERLEQEAVVSEFTASDFGPNGGTNNEGPVVAFDYQLLNPLTLTVRNYFTNYIERPANSSNPTLYRLQLDALVKF